MLIAYLSYSGNTKEVAEYIADRITEEGWSATLHLIGYSPAIDVSIYDIVFIGTFTWDYGEVPEEVEQFMMTYKKQITQDVAVFGTGDTQFGDDSVYCRAVDELVSFYKSKWSGLKIEQSPRGSQEKLIDQWVEGVMKDAINIVKTC